MKTEMLYEGKAKQIYSTNEENKIVIYYKDDATAFNGVKKAQISEKGVMNNAISAIIYNELEANGVRTHFIEKLSDREQLCHKVDIVPLEVICRNVIAGSMAKRLAIKEGTVPNEPVLELSYKDDDLGDPLINDHHALAMNVITRAELDEIYAKTEKINEVLKNLFARIGINLVDFKLEFGKLATGEIVLADEVSPDTCRLWDKETNEKLDKDRFRRDLGNVEDAYSEILKRLETETK